ncbi:MAG TPA: ThuA domain-containing protein, partial [Luteimonas sp.]|nr:ThuA domain-containing protein [Luteimonas sp.]
MPAERPRLDARRAVLLLLAGLLAIGGCTPRPARTVLLIGGNGVHGAGHHDHAAGIEALRRLLQADAATRGNLRVVAFPQGWPPAAAFEDAATAVLYFEGDTRHPLHDGARRAVFDAAVARGMGVVALHQASTATAGDDLGIGGWLGAVRRGLRDRTTEYATLRFTAGAGDLARGAGQPIAYRDEFYPTLERMGGAGRFEPVLEATLHPQFRDGRHLVEARAEAVDVAWRFTRPGGGRAFGFTGMHFTAAFDVPALRTLLRNAVLWTAGLPVPATPPPGPPAAPSAATRGNGRSAAAPGATGGHIGFHGGAARGGWLVDAGAPERTLLGPQFGEVWSSPRFASHSRHPPRLYASPLFVPALDIRGGEHRGARFDALVAATSNGDVYAINTRRAGDVAAGRILWRAALGAPCMLAPAPLDG